MIVCDILLVFKSFWANMAYLLSSTNVTLPCFEGFNAFAAWPVHHLVSKYSLGKSYLTGQSRQIIASLTGLSRQIIASLTGLSRQIICYLTGPYNQRSRQMICSLRGPYSKVYGKIIASLTGM